MKIKLLGKNLDDIRPLLKKFGLEESDSGFELVITHGGDGALLGAERDYPGIPKYPLCDAATASPCGQHSAEVRLQELISGKAKAFVLPKVAAKVNGKEITALNDVFIHNFERASALRYRVWIDGELYAHEIVGDGVCLSSVHGSSAYYRSITGGMFRVGMGLAFSHANADIDHLILDSASVVELTIIRGPGMVIADNDPTHLQLENGESVIFRTSDKTATIYGLEGFMCGACRKIRHGM